MANYTENFRLKKPEPEDFYDIEDFNGNMDILDSKVKSLDDSNTILKESMEILKSDVGTTKDTGGTTTAGSVFSKLNKLLTDWTSTRASRVDSIYNNTLTSSTSSSTGTLSQKLNYIISKDVTHNQTLENLSTEFDEKVKEFELQKKIQDLAILGKKSDVIYDYDTLLEIAKREETFKNTALLRHILDGVVLSNKNIGVFLNTVCGMESEILPSYSSISSIAQKADACREILANEKAKKLLYLSDYALYHMCCIYPATYVLAEDSEFYERLRDDAEFKNKILNTTNIVSEMVKHEKYIRLVMDNSDTFKDFVQEFKRGINCFHYTLFGQILLEEGNEYFLKTILRDPYYTSQLLYVESSAKSTLNNSKMIAYLEDEKNVAMLANVLRSKYATVVYKDNDKILSIASKNINCLISLSELGKDIDATFYANIQKYYSNMYSTIVNKKGATTSLSKTYTSNASKNGKGIFYTFEVNSTASAGDMKIYGDSSKTKLLKTIPKGTASGTNFNVVCFGSFYLEMVTTNSNCKCNYITTF